MYAVIKNILDRILALLGIIVTAPLMLLTAAAVACDGKGEVLFRQERLGQNAKPFFVCKFRTMVSAHVAFDATKPLIDGKDGRVTAVGRFLRKFKLDELPQLFNVLVGEMSLVGPRPLLKDFNPLYGGWEYKKYDCKPGLTGLAQVNGNGTLRLVSRSYYDVLYAETYSLRLDVKILFKTIGVILLGEEHYKKEVSDDVIAALAAKYQKSA